MHLLQVLVVDTVMRLLEAASSVVDWQLVNNEQMLCCIGQVAVCRLSRFSMEHLLLASVAP